MNEEIWISGQSDLLDLIYDTASKYEAFSAQSILSNQSYFMGVFEDVMIMGRGKEGRKHVILTVRDNTSAEDALDIASHLVHKVAKEYGMQNEEDDITVRAVSD